VIHIYNKFILIMATVLMVTMISGCSTLEGDYENSLLSFKIPDNWTVDNSNSSDSLASLKTWDNQWIYIQTSDVDPAEIIDSYIQNYPVEYPRFQVLSREPVQVDGRKGEKLVFKNTAQNDFLLVGPDYTSSVVAFSKDNKTIIITSSEALADNYYSRVEPAMEVVVNSLRIKNSLIN